MASTFTTLASALKERYAKTVEDVTYPEDPWYARVKKEKGWGGKTTKIPIIYGHNQSGSATFANAQTNAGNIAMSAWDMDTSNNKKHYTIAKIPGDLIAAMEGGKEKAFFPAVTAEVDSAMKAAARRLAIDGFREGYGTVGRMSNAAAASTTVTLSNANDTANFEVGMVLEFAAAEKSGAKRAGTATVASVDEDAGTIALDQNTNAVSGLAQNDFIFIMGDRQATAASRLRMVGMEGWIPYDRTLITSSTFFGVNRLLHPARLAGRYVDGSTMRLKEALLKAAMLAAKQGNPNAAYLSWDKWLQLEFELGSAVTYEDVETANTGFRAIVINGPKGKIQIFPSLACPSTRAHVVTQETWTLLSLGEPIGFLDRDENQMLRLSTADQYEIRIGGYVELLCESPVQNCIVNW